MSRTARVGQGALALIGVLCTVIALSVYAPTDAPLDPDTQALVATFGAGFGILATTLAIAGLNTRQNWAWLGLWALPTFLVSHVVLLGTVVPDAVLAAFAVAALIATRPAVRAEQSGQASSITSAGTTTR